MPHRVRIGPLQVLEIGKNTPGHFPITRGGLWFLWLQAIYGKAQTITFSFYSFIHILKIEGQIDYKASAMWSF